MRPLPTPEAVRAVWLTMTYKQMCQHFHLKHHRMSVAIQLAGGASERRKAQDAVKYAEFQRIGATMTRQEAAEYFRISEDSLYRWMEATGVKCLIVDKAERAKRKPITESRFNKLEYPGVTPELYAQAVRPWCPAWEEADA